LTVRYQYFRDIVTNANVGQFNLPETGSDHTRSGAHASGNGPQIIGAHAINESRFQFVHADNENTPLQTGRPWMLAERLEERQRRVRHIQHSESLRISEHHLFELRQACWKFAAEFALRTIATRSAIISTARFPSLAAES